jgi:hypothetical protein
MTYQFLYFRSNPFSLVFILVERLFDHRIKRLEIASCSPETVNVIFRTIPIPVNISRAIVESTVNDCYWLLGRSREQPEDLSHRQMDELHRLSHTNIIKD